MNASVKKHRSKAAAHKVIGFSVSYQHDELLARGLGIEHLRELLVRLARPLLRQGASLAYGGHWRENDENFTYDLLRLISTEQEDNTLGGPDTNLTIGRLYNHSAWPHYLEITPQIEAQWINCCTIVRFTQGDAGFLPAELVPNDETASRSNRATFNAACTLSAMRRGMNDSSAIVVPDAQPVMVPPIAARIVLGGKTCGFSGFVPGIFEETLIAMETGRPLYLLGGFGGAAEVVAREIISSSGQRPPEMTVDWHRQNTSAYVELLQRLGEFRRPELARDPATVFDLFWQKLVAARSAPATALNTGLTDDETRQLMTTPDVQTALRLVRAGLAQTCSMKQLPA